MKPPLRTFFLASGIFCTAILLNVSQAAGAQNVWEALQATPSDPCNWAGFYIGVNVGGSFNRFDLGKQSTDVDLVQQFYTLFPEPGEGESGLITFHTPGHHETETETIGGGQTGFNLQFGHFVVGMDGSFQGNGNTIQTNHHDFQENELFLFTEQQFVTADTEFRNERMVETRWNASIGGILGFCWNRFLFYGAGGAAFTDVHFSSMDVADTSFFGFVGDGNGITHPAVRRITGGPRQGENFLGEIVSKKEHTQGDVMTGWYGGVGTMYQLTNLVSAGFEYRHVDWGSVNENLMGGDGPVFPGNGHLDLTADQVLFKVNIIVGPFGH